MTVAPPQQQQEGRVLVDLDAREYNLILRLRQIRRQAVVTLLVAGDGVRELWVQDALRERL